jgi:hypothetical protein
MRGNIAARFARADRDLIERPVAARAGCWLTEGVNTLVDPQKDLAYYYPAWGWSRWSMSESSIKNLILFFDGVAVFVPSSRKGEPFQADPALVSEMSRLGLFTILEAEALLDRPAAEELASRLVDLIETGVFDNLPEQIGHARDRIRQQRTKGGMGIVPAAGEIDSIARLSMYQLGMADDPGLANMIHTEFRNRDLAGPIDSTGVFIVDPAVAVVVRILLAQLVRVLAARHALTLHPVTDNPDLHDALVELLGLPTLPSAASIATLDAQTVGVDLTAVPFDEVLGFKADHDLDLRAYVRDLRRFLHDVASLTVEDRQSEILDRQAEIRDTAARIRRSAENAWKRPAVFGLSLAGAAWTLKSGDFLGGLLSLGAAALGPDSRDDEQAGAFSYLMKGATRFGGT